MPESEAKVYDNLWHPGKKYSDLTSHFSRMTSELVSRYFSATQGVFARWPHSPNWLEHTPDGYEMVQMSGDEVVSRGGIFFRISANPKLESTVVTNPLRGKTVAYWNYSLLKDNINEQDNSLKVFSDDELKGIVAYQDGSIYANACRFTRTGGMPIHRSQLIIQSLDGVIPHTPFVNLAFFMWLEEDDEGKAVAEWLRNAMKWNTDGQA